MMTIPTPFDGSNGTSGYLHPDYAESLGEFGVPLALPRCGGWILKRRIPGFPYHDGMGCYPLFSCQDWGQLSSDLNDVDAELVSLTLVADPLGHYDQRGLGRCFPDVFTPFKSHFVVDLCQDLGTFISRHHRRQTRKAVQALAIETSTTPADWADDWVHLYAGLIERYDITGISAFSRSAFVKQLHVPGIIAFRALRYGKTIGMMLWYRQGESAYYHLGACSSAGYQWRASYALVSAALEHFGTSGLRWLNLGAGAGLNGNDEDGLSRFKRGWSTGTRTAYLCGRILNQDRYRAITNATGTTESRYFPAYRSGEFT